MELSIGYFGVFLLAVLTPVQPTPTHISGPDDRFLFSGQSTTLQCVVEGMVNSALLWQHIDGNGQGVHIGKCFSCPEYDDCVLELGQYASYSLRRKGNVYELDIYNTSVQSETQFGYFQCGHVTLDDCESRRIISRYFLLQSAFVYVYEPPTCSVTTLSYGPDYGLEFTCTGKPHFYQTAKKTPKTRIIFGPNVTFTEIVLPYGVVRRTYTDTIADDALGYAQCEVMLPDGRLNRSCEFPDARDSKASTYVEPFIVDVEEGKETEIRCFGPKNKERKWKFIREDGKVVSNTSTIHTIAGNVRFTSSTKEILFLTRHTRYNRFIIECIIEGTDTEVSAFAFLMGEAMKAMKTMKTVPLQTFEPYVPNNAKPTRNSAQNNTYLIIYIVIPAALIILFLVIGLAIICKKTKKRSLKQPPRKPDTAIYVKNDTSNEIYTNINENGDYCKRP